MNVTAVCLILSSTNIFCFSSVSEIISISIAPLEEAQRGKYMGSNIDSATSKLYDRNQGI